jgi:hypothetical protein
MAVILSAVLGIWTNVYANYDAAPLDQRYSESWDSLSEATRWWLALSKTVGPSPPLAPGALAQAGLSLLLATLHHPALRRAQAPPSKVEDDKARGGGTHTAGSQKATCVSAPVPAGAASATQRVSLARLPEVPGRFCYLVQQPEAPVHRRSTPGLGVSLHATTATITPAVSSRYATQEAIAQST